MNRLDVLLHVLFNFVLIEVLKSSIRSIRHAILPGTTSFGHNHVSSELSTTLSCLPHRLFLCLQVLVGIGTSSLCHILFHGAELLRVIAVNIKDIDD